MPLAFFAGIIQVKHGGHRVDPQTIDMEFIQPVKSVGHQEVSYLVATKVENQGPPIGLFPAGGIRMFIEFGAIKVGERKLVFGEMAGNPVHDHPDSRLVQFIYQIAEIIGSTIAGRGRIVAALLVTPGTIEGMLRNWHHFYVSKAHIFDIGNQIVSQIPIVGVIRPGSDMHLIDRHGGVMGIGFCPLVHPLLVFPLVVFIGNYRGRQGRNLAGARHRVGFLLPGAIRS